MPRLKNYDRFALSLASSGSGGVLTHRQLKELGVPLSTITRRILPTGPWQRLCRGVVLTHRGTPTVHERRLGVLAYAGPSALITGVHALVLHGVKGVEPTWPARVLIPAGNHRSANDLVIAERTHRLPEPILRGGLRVTPPARALVDAVRHLRRLDEVRELVAAIVQQGFCSVAALVEEVRAAARQGTALSRAVLREVSEGLRSVAEAKARSVFLAHGIPMPQWNMVMVDGAGTPLASPDGFWEEFRTVLEIDSIRWHLGPADFKRTQEKQRLYASVGLLNIPVAPQVIIDETASFVAVTQEVLARGALLPPAKVTMIPAR